MRQYFLEEARMMRTSYPRSVERIHAGPGFAAPFLRHFVCPTSRFGSAALLQRQKCFQEWYEQRNRKIPQCRENLSGKGRLALGTCRQDD